MSDLNLAGTLRKPRRLSPGDRVAAVTPSWGGPGTFPHRYAAGKRQFEEAFGVTIVEMEHTLADPDWVKRNPRGRAEDLMAAFADPSIAGIIATIGGDDSIRLLPYLDLDVLRTNPKILLGFSDTTSLHFACLTAGITSFYGPSVMAGLAENGGMHDYTRESLRRALFDTAPIGSICFNNEGWTSEHLDWSDSSLQSRRRKMNPASPPKLLQGSGQVSGPLIGGCAEVLEMVKATDWWPRPEQWQGSILFYETSEDAPSPNFVRYWLRNFAAQGILQRLSGMIVARPDPAGDPTYGERLHQAITAALAEEGLSSLPVLADLDFGHTQPMTTLPFGAMARLDCDARDLVILESGVV